MVTSLEDQLKRVIERHGEKTPYVQMLRDQIHAQTNNKSVEETYITGGGHRPVDPGDSEK